MKLLRQVITTAAVGAAFLGYGCKEKTPNRDYFLQIKEQIVKLQNAVRKRDRGPVEALLTSDYVARGGADSVVQFSFGDRPGFEFAAYGRAVILYTNERARVDCFVSDSAGHELRPATLTFEHVKDSWLLKRIEPRLPAPDSTGS